MFCSKCGKQIEESSGWCIHCGAQCGTVQADKAAAKKCKTVTAVIIVAVVIVCAVIGFVVSGNRSGLSGSWEYIADPYVGGYDYTIELNSNGTCVIYEYGRIPYSATYRKNDDGTYITSSLLTSTIFGSWRIRKDGKDLLISGSGLGNNARFTKVY